MKPRTPCANSTAARSSLNPPPPLRRCCSPTNCSARRMRDPPSRIRPSKTRRDRLAEAKKQGATYCDIRINRYRNQFTGYRLSPERGGSKTDEVPYVYDGSSFGFGVRVIAKGQWDSPRPPTSPPPKSPASPAEAVTVAKANSILQAQPVQLAPTKAYIDRWSSPFERIPSRFPSTKSSNCCTPPRARSRTIRRYSARSVNSSSTARTNTLPRRKDLPSSS